MTTVRSFDHAFDGLITRVATTESVPRRIQSKPAPPRWESECHATIMSSGKIESVYLNMLGWVFFVLGRNTFHWYSLTACYSSGFTVVVVKIMRNIRYVCPFHSTQPTLSACSFLYVSNASLSRYFSVHLHL